MIIFCLIKHVKYIYFDLMYSNHTMHVTQGQLKLKAICAVQKWPPFVYTQQKF